MTERDDWLCVGGTCRRLRPTVVAGLYAWLERLHMLAPGRLLTQGWIRYRMDVTSAAPPPADVELRQVTDDLMLSLSGHPDAGQNQLRSGIRFWEHGFRNAYVWVAEEGPLCIQWLLTPQDNARLFRLGEWAALYPPLPPGTGRVENLFVFSGSRRKGVATQFELRLFEMARRAGLARIVTHIHEGNASAIGWAERMGWERYGTITRYQLDVPRLRAMTLALHGPGMTARAAPASASPRPTAALVAGGVPHGRVSA